MKNEDFKRELQKVLEAIEAATEYHEKSNEANAALHLSERVLYSPLTAKLQTADNTLRNLLLMLEIDDE